VRIPVVLGTLAWAALAIPPPEAVVTGLDHIPIAVANLAR
jgi:hypothetical protein